MPTGIPMFRLLHREHIPIDRILQHRHTHLQKKRCVFRGGKFAHFEFIRRPHHNALGKVLVRVFRELVVPELFRNGRVELVAGGYEGVEERGRAIEEEWG